MENIRNSFFGYNKNDVKNLIFEKDQIISTQQKDIDYLRSKQSTVHNTNKVNDTVATIDNSSRFINLKQERLSEQMASDNTPHA